MTKPTLGAFSAEVFSVIRANQDLLREHRVCQSGVTPLTLPELIDIARDVAVDLIVFRAADEARAYFRKDSSGLAAIDTLMNKVVSEDDVRAVIRRVHASLQDSVTLYPYHAFALFLSELCRSLHVVTHRPQLQASAR